MKIGVYVGSFNPVHKGHIQVINYLLNNNIIDKVIVIPTGTYWEKNNLIDIEYRINMLKFYESNNIIINNKLNNLQYTYQVIRELKKEYDDLYIIIGSDNIPKFHLWKNIEEILENKIIVMNRDNLDINSYINNFKQRNQFILVNEFKSLKVSSTLIRKLIKENNIKKLNNYLDIKIIEYIQTNNLYRE